MVTTTMTESCDGGGGEAVVTRMMCHGGDEVVMVEIGVVAGGGLARVGGGCGGYDVEGGDGGAAWSGARGRKPALSFMRLFGCPVTILNTIDHLGKFDGKANSTNSKAFRVFYSRTRIVEENMHVQFIENTPNIAGSGRNWLFDIDALTKSMNYKPVVARNQSNCNASTKACNDAGIARMKTIHGQDYILLPMWLADLIFSQNSKDSLDAGFKPSGEEEKKDAEDLGNECGNQTKEK
ncbi:hypothetical protein Tco_0581969 [Tanacetum coccineum]